MNSAEDQRRYVHNKLATLSNIVAPRPCFWLSGVFAPPRFRKRVLKGTSVDLVAAKGTAMTTISLLYIALSACVSIGFVIAGLLRTAA